LEFDLYGNLAPYSLIEINLINFEDRFVHAYKESKTRAKLFENYSNYVNSLKLIIGTGFFQWIDGSFVTNKLNPKDIDFVTFIDWKVYYNNEILLDSLRELRYNKILGIDGYIVLVYPPEHKKNILYEADRLQWIFEFSRSRTDQRKGFIQINY